jgi:hypothetical protein
MYNLINLLNRSEVQLSLNADGLMIPAVDENSNKLVVVPSAALGVGLFQRLRDNRKTLNLWYPHFAINNWFGAHTANYDSGFVNGNKLHRVARYQDGIGVLGGGADTPEIDDGVNLSAPRGVREDESGLINVSSFILLHIPDTSEFPYPTGGLYPDFLSNGYGFQYTSDGFDFSFSLGDYFGGIYGVPVATVKAAMVNGWNWLSVRLTQSTVNQQYFQLSAVVNGTVVATRTITDQTIASLKTKDNSSIGTSMYFNSTFGIAMVLITNTSLTNDDCDALMNSVMTEHGVENG